jgi:tetratricopeptide (TPR) repeat protein
MRMRGYCADALKDAAAAARHYTWALQLATESGDKTREAQVRLGLGASLFKAGEAGTAKAHLEAALALGRAVGDEAAVAAASGNLGKVLMAGGESAAAGERFREAFALREKHKDARGCAVQSINVGSAAALEEKVAPPLCAPRYPSQLPAPPTLRRLLRSLLPEP